MSTALAVPGRATSARARSSRTLKWLMISPAVLVILGLILFPVIYTIRLSLTGTIGAVGSGAPFVGLANYWSALTDTQRFWPAVLRTLVFTLGALSLELVLGTAVALLLRKPFRGSGLVRTVMMVPLVTSPIAVGAVWLLLLDPNLGLVNQLLGQVGFAPKGWLTDPTLSLPVLIMLDVWQFTPLIILLMLAGLAGLPAEPEEAALVDGANAWQRLRYVTLPMLKTAIVTAGILRGIDALKTFDLIFATKGPGGGSSNEAETLNVYIYGLSFDYLEIGLASAVLVLFFLLVLGAALGVIQRAFKERL